VQIFYATPVFSALFRATSEFRPDHLSKTRIMGLSDNETILMIN